MTDYTDRLTGFDRWTLNKHRSETIDIVITHQHKLVKAAGNLVDIDAVVDDAVSRMREKLASVKTLKED